MSTTINQLTASTLKSFPVPIPPMEVQSEISRYLDEQCSDIDSVSKNIRASIEKLGKYRAALITAAVTGQLPELNG